MLAYNIRGACDFLPYHATVLVPGFLIVPGSDISMSKINSELLDQQLKAEAPVAEANCAVSVYSVEYSCCGCFIFYVRLCLRRFIDTRIVPQNSIVLAEAASSCLVLCAV